MPQLSLTEADRTFISQEEARRIAHTVVSVRPTGGEFDYSTKCCEPSEEEKQH